jgi:hypothetical protein
LAFQNDIKRKVFQKVKQTNAAEGMMGHTIGMPHASLTDLGAGDKFRNGENKFLQRKFQDSGLHGILWGKCRCCQIVTYDNE